MRALSLVQPWATLIMVGEKRIETRSWGTSHKGKLAIHASAGKPKYAREFCQEPEVEEILERHGLDWETLPRGVVVGTTEVLTCTGISRWTGEVLRVAREIETYAGTVTGLPEDEYLFGDYSPGRYAWILGKVEPFLEPVPARGSLGLWKWEPDTP